jgi:hypothetical protein
VPCSDCALYTLAFALQLRIPWLNRGIIMVKLQSGRPKNFQFISAQHDLFSRLDHPVVTSNGLPTTAANSLALQATEVNPLSA